MSRTTIEIQLENDEIATIIMRYVIINYMHRGDDFDDAGCDWFTDAGCTYIGGDDWFVSSNPHVAALVDAANILRYGKILKLEANHDSD